MKPANERKWTAYICVYSDQPELQPYFQQLEDELRFVLAREDNPNVIAEYLTALTERSRWARAFREKKRVDK